MRADWEAPPTGCCCHCKLSSANSIFTSPGFLFFCLSVKTHSTQVQRAADNSPPPRLFFSCHAGKHHSEIVSSSVCTLRIKIKNRFVVNVCGVPRFQKQSSRVRQMLVQYSHVHKEVTGLCNRSVKRRLPDLIPP